MAADDTRIGANHASHLDSTRVRGVLHGMAAPVFSLIVPTRGRPAQLNQFLTSLAKTTSRPRQVEVILVVDSDDAPPSVPKLPFEVRIETGPPGRTMGELNNAGFVASRGEFVMLLNDDVIAKTRSWDRTVSKQFRRFPDGLALVHVNDTLIRDHLCTFPILSRRCIELLGGFCPAEYERYRIDDHIQDPFDLLIHAGVCRTVYLPDVVFEHRNSVNHPTAGAVYESDPAILARDAPRFDSMQELRKRSALKMLERIESRLDPAKAAKIAAVVDSFALRMPGRQIVVRAPWPKRVPEFVKRLQACCARGGLLKAIRRRLFKPFAVSRREAAHFHLAPGFAGERSESKPRRAVSAPGEGALECVSASPPHPPC
jgi:hypothetical protein